MIPPKILSWGDTVMQGLVFLTLVCILGGSAVAGYWIFLEPVPYVITEPSKVYSAGDYAAILRGKAMPETGDFVAGEVLYILRGRCILKEVDSTTRRELIVAELIVASETQSPLSMFPLPPTAQVSPKGCARVWIPVIIPGEIPPGRYLFRATSIFTTNLLRTDLIRAPDIPVTIVWRRSKP